MILLFLRRGGSLAVLAFLIAVLALWSWRAIGAEARALHAHGEATEATIVDTRRLSRPDTTGGTSFNYFVTVSFATGDAMAGTIALNRAEGFVSRRFYDTVSVGDVIPIRYLPDDPTVVEIQPGGTAENSSAALWVGLGMLALSAGITVYLWPGVASAHRIETRGINKTGTVTQVTRNGEWVTLRVAYRGPDGKLDDATTLPVSRKKVFPPEVGDAVTLRLDPQDPHAAKLV